MAPEGRLCVTCAQQFAEKVHAYTFPWTDRENTRVKDLVDLVLLIERAAMPPDAVARCVRLTFDVRNTHAQPRALAMPPAGWRPEFERLAAQVGLSSLELAEAFTVLDRFWSSLPAHD